MNQPLRAKARFDRRSNSLPFVTQDCEPHNIVHGCSLANVATQERFASQAEAFIGLDCPPVVGDRVCRDSVECEVDERVIQSVK